MNIRERFLATMRFEDCPKTPRWEFGFWAGTLQRWYKEGLPGTQQEMISKKGAGDWVFGTAQAFNGIGDVPRDEDVAAFFNMDNGAFCVPLNSTMCPIFDEVVIEETEEYIIKKGGNGITFKKPKIHQKESMPVFSHHIDYPVKTRNDWEKIKTERYQPDIKGRLPADWDSLVEQYKNRDFPLCLGDFPAGFFGAVRQLLGFEKTVMTFLDDPAWMHDMMDHLADFYVGLYSQVLSIVDVDYAFSWEDMCYNTGPMISPQMFKDFMFKPYQKVSNFLRDHGIDIYMVDTDGDANSLLPLFTEAGVNAMYPFEVNSNMDVAEVRKNYPKLAMQGGIDKTALAKDKKAIDKELEAKVPVVLGGGYIPHVDHGVPPDVSWENYCYYRTKLDVMLDEYDEKRNKG